MLLTHVLHLSGDGGDICIKRAKGLKDSVLPAVSLQFQVWQKLNEVCDCDSPEHSKEGLLIQYFYILCNLGILPR